MKKLLMIGLIILCAALTACEKPGITDNVTIDKGVSEKFSEEELNGAVNCVIQRFENFKGCELTKLWYDEEHSNSWTKEYTPGTAIVLLSEFNTGHISPNSGFNPNYTYENWSWILTREDENADWQVKDYGY